MKLRRHYKLLLAFIVVVVGLLGWLGEVRVIPYTVSSDTYAQDFSDENSTLNQWGQLSGDDFFDENEEMHIIEIDIDPDDYENMILTYEETMEKDYYPITITIDGVTIENVGIRLKGNSSLRSAMDMGMGGPGVYRAPEGDNEDDYETPFLIKFDEYENGQTYMGYTEIALRAQFNDRAAMREFLSNEIMQEMGLIASRSVYTTVNINGEGNELYMITEVVNEDFAIDHLGATEYEMGDLIKTGGNSHMKYLGDDPTEYETYELQTNENVSDFYDMIEFFEFIGEASDEEFLDEIDEMFDMDTVIKYLAFNNVLVNLDSFAGNGNNYYIYQFPDTDQFMVVPWDVNESFGQFGMQGPNTWELGLYFEEYKGRQMMGQPGGGRVPGGIPPGGELPQNNEDGVKGQANILDIVNIGFPDDFPEQNLPPNMRPPKGDRPLRQMPGTRPLIFEEDMPLDELSPLMDRIFSNEEYEAQYLAEIESLLENEFELEKMMDRIQELTEFLREQSSIHGFWTEQQLREFRVGVDEITTFVRERCEYLQDLLQAELSN